MSMGMKLGFIMSGTEPRPYGLISDLHKISRTDLLPCGHNF